MRLQPGGSFFEEAGVCAELRPLFRFRYRSENNDFFAEVYLAEHDGELHVSKDEIKQGRFMPRQEIEEMMKTEKFLPETLMILEKCKQ